MSNVIEMPGRESVPGFTPIEPTAIEGEHVTVELLRNLVQLKHLPHKQTRSGLVIPEHLQTKTGETGLAECEVIAVGPGAYQSGRHRPMQVKAGDRVLVHKKILGGEMITIGGQKYLICAEDFIVCVIRRESKAD